MINVIPTFEAPFLAKDGGQDPLGILGYINCCYKSSLGFVYCCRKVE
ncbi:MAG: hypothetical protein HXS48_00670 [Theionarchaea archaeon]|nr:hypothetical protein [Theionarchaea archaeon]